MGNLGLPREKTRVEFLAYINLAIKIGPVISQRGYVGI